ncbi:MAG: hypothetical protein COB41_02370 [Proteobacteria bacterium]|nr:MAG: hypothetical protein COB41_02370 [Pseudomonadota bacterium]
MFFRQKKICAKACGWLCKLGLFGMFFLYASYGYSEELADVRVDTTQSVIYCDISSEIGVEKLKLALKEGSLMTYSWEIIIEENRDYWLNKSIGSVQLSRQVVPDLVSRQWLLKDSTSGITNATLSTHKAISFLASLKNFPIIDKSLLQSGVSYTIKVRLYIEEGEVSDHWWDAVTKLGKTVAIGSFTLP